VILYLIGRFGGRPIAQKTERLLKLKESTVKKLEDRFEKSGAKIIFYVKATTGLAFIAFILAGTVKMNFKKFLQFSFLGGVVWSGMLVLLGYFFGYAAVQIEKYIKFAGWAIFGIALLTFFYLISASKRKSFGKFFSEIRNSKNEKTKKHRHN
jgi:membrane protein DedA with SNARE-associated domain